METATSPQWRWQTTGSLRNSLFTNFSRIAQGEGASGVSPLTIGGPEEVLAVRYKDHTESYTKLHKAPTVYPGFYRERVVLELKGNPFPPLEKKNSSHNWIHNILLEEAHQEYIRKKLKEGEGSN
ncbi:uncharacterized protein LOC123517705 isoform X3 [Portunus trituberculatus]|uniref:uncharacterized protein LOC123517705 isoform X3 n=1 Tax=Portunus trituberculatus TaxID=210409 RepID=UPI001E1CB0C0|nr:uncharacterized protein LOC123517705 isoform X3 [Portunus trituberculatus]